MAAINISPAKGTGGAQKKEAVQFYKTTTDGTADTETLRGTGYTVTAGKTLYITDIILEVNNESASALHVYLKHDSAVLIGNASKGGANSSSGFTTTKLHLQTPIEIAAGEVLRFADKSPAASLEYNGYCMWVGFEV